MLFWGQPVEMPQVDYYANWLYVKDIVRAYLLAVQAPRPEHIIFNVGGFVYRCSEVVELLKKLVPEVPGRQKDIPHCSIYALNQNRAKEEFGYEPVYTLEEAVKDYIKTMEELGDQYKLAWSAYKVTPLL